MAKLEVKFELTGLKFEITGERDDVSVALASLQQQVATLVQSASAAAGAVEYHPPQNGKLLAGQTTLAGGTAQVVEGEPHSTLATSSARSKGKRATGTPRVAAEPVQFSHDAEKYGFPKQEWNTANKAMWILYIIEMQTEQKEASAHVIAATFKFYFKEFGNPLTHNIVRDLGASKKKGLVNSDPTKNPETWYLLAAGKTAIQALIQNPSASEASVAE